MTIMRRGKTFHLRKRVPVQYKDVEPRKSVYVSLHTDSETIARQKAPAIWQEQIEAWEARQAGDTADAEKRYEAAQRLAKARGFRFLSAERVAQLPTEELLQRMESAKKRDGDPDMAEAAAILGGARLCCTNRVKCVLLLSPDGLILRALLQGCQELCNGLARRWRPAGRSPAP